MQLSERFGNLPIRYRVMTALLGIVLLAEACTGYMVFRQYKASMISQSLSHIADIRNTSIRDIRTKFHDLIIQVDQLSSLPDIIKDLSREHQTSGTSDNAFNTGIAGPMQFVKENTRLHDLFVIAKNGDIVHTLANGSDAGSNLLTGPYRDSELANTFRKSQEMLQTHISDVAYYVPSDGQALFIVTPVIHGNRVLGAIAGQINMEDLTGLLKSYTGLGQTGEVVAGILRGDKAYLAPLRNMPSAKFNLEIPMGANKAGPIQQALRGNVDSGFDLDYRGIEVIAAWGYIPEFQMGTVVKMDVDELLAPVMRMQYTTLLIVTFIMFITVIIGYFLAASITAPINTLTEAVMQYAKGDRTIRHKVTRRDEIGLLAHAFNSMADNIDRSSTTIQKKNQALTQAAASLEDKVIDRTATLAAANEEIKSFAYIVSHDLRSPLVNMKGFTSELGYALKEVSEKISGIEDKLEKAERDDLNRLFEDEIPESMHFITTSVDKMDAMLTSILKLSRLGRRELQFEAIDLKKLCDDALMSLAHQIDETGTAISFGELPVIDNDRMVMEQIMGNLIGNAIKYLSPGRPGEIRIWSESNDKGIAISVQDNGRGISDAEREKVFQIFRRGRHQDVVGEGMGLAYVQTLARAQNGSISYTSIEDQGSTFTVFLPHQTINEA